MTMCLLGEQESGIRVPVAAQLGYIWPMQVWRKYTKDRLADAASRSTSIAGVLRNMGSPSGEVDTIVSYGIG